LKEEKKEGRSRAGGNTKKKKLWPKKSETHGIKRQIGGCAKKKDVPQNAGNREGGRGGKTPKKKKKTQRLEERTHRATNREAFGAVDNAGVVGAEEQCT